MSGTLDYFKSVADFAENKEDKQKSMKVAEDSSKPEISLPWVEKYRPKSVDEIVFQEEVVAMLKKCVKGADLPNVLFHGPPGTGKTSAAVALCRQLFRTHDCYSDRVLELNASDERGIDVVRNRIKSFSRLAVAKPSGKKLSKAVLALRIVILDEADAMTNAAQAALRRIMEDEIKSTRFFLICNYITRIIHPLTSRCAKFRFKPLSVDAQQERLQFICESENVPISSAAIDQLISVSGGDLRKSITLLQSLACSSSLQITEEDVRELSGYVPDVEINQLMTTAKYGNVSQLLKLVKKFNNQGFSAYQVIGQLTDVILANDLLKVEHKAEIFLKMAECEKRLLDGAEDFLQLLDLLTVVHKCFFHVDD